MKNYILILSLFAFSIVQADRRREILQEEEALLEARQELLLYRKKFEDLRVNRWQDKRNVVAKKEAYQEIHNETKLDVEALQSNKNQKEETLLRLQKQLEESTLSLEEQKIRLREFGVQSSTKLNEFTKKLISSYPQNLLKERARADDINTELQNSDYRITRDKIVEIFSQQKSVFLNNEKRVIERTTMPMQGYAKMALGMDTKLTAQVVAGHKINLGGIYKAFTSTESEDVAILSKTGRVDDQAWDWVESVLPEKREALNTLAKQITNSDTSKAMLVPIDVQLKRAVGEGYSSARISTFWKDIIDELKGAGFVIYGMGLLAFLSIWIMADKIRIFSYRGREGKKFSKEIFALIDDNRIDDAIHFAKLHHGSVPFIFRAVLKGIKKNKGRDEIENIAFERILHETPIIEKGIGTINIFAAAAPLLGLLGTVSGMVNLFAAITLHGTSDPKIMAAGIAEALLSTKWGLIVAIPLLLIYNWTKNQSEKIISNMEKYTAKLINHLYGTSHGLDLESKKKKKKEKKKKKKEKENNPEEDIEAISTNA